MAGLQPRPTPRTQTPGEGRAMPQSPIEVSWDNGLVTAEAFKSPASFLGAGASLVDIDSLLSFTPKQPPLNVITQQQSILQGPSMAGPMGSVMPNAGVSWTTFPSNSSLFGPTLSPYNVTQPRLASPNCMHGFPLSQISSKSLRMPHPGLAMPAIRPQVAPPYVGPRMVQLNSVGGIPQAGQAAVAQLGVSTSTAGGGVLLQPNMVWGTATGELSPQNKNPFLF
ncbi:hypothetical protein UPYG_G00339770 [Umbra pygmaea]|uniref:Uncharacterized protein n=1 Tax=Umbra pygmaea TaxID=75934 RepID=A0ABD0W108_UMBPY